jgi:hypothetical protein
MPTPLAYREDATVPKSESVPEWKFVKAHEVKEGDRMRHGKIVAVEPGHNVVTLRSDQGVAITKHPYAPVEVLREQ